jgi:hypothetical protein
MVPGHFRLHHSTLASVDRAVRLVAQEFEGHRCVWQSKCSYQQTTQPEQSMAARKKSASRRYSRGASKDVERAMRRRKKGTLRSGRGGKGGKVKSRKQAIAIGLSEARAKGKKVPRKKTGGRKTGGRKTAGRKRSSGRKRSR